jgi:hypothetical protein
MSRVKGVVEMVAKSFTGGQSFVSNAPKTKTSGKNPAKTMTGISPFEAAIHTGRIHEREDILTYLTSLAVVTGSEELWEAVDHIKNGKHKR